MTDRDGGTAGDGVLPYIGYVFDDSLLVLPQGHIALGKVFHDYLVKSGPRQKQYPARQELLARVEFQRQLCDGVLGVLLLTEAGTFDDIRRETWANDEQLTAALSGWHTLHDGQTKGIFVCRLSSVDVWRNGVTAEEARRTTQLSPYLAVMIRAAEELGISETNALNKGKDVAPALTRIWDATFPGLRGKLSRTESERMATFVRWPEAKLGTGSTSNVRRKRLPASK